MPASQSGLFLVLSIALVVPLGTARGHDNTNESIVVTATRLPRNAATSASLSILTAEDLARRQTNFLVEALATLPGVTVTQSGAFGGSTTLRLRGAASEQTLVLIDGVAVNDVTGAGGGFNFAFLDAFAVERVEVLRGSQSTLWGSDAIGGVVNIITRRPEPGLVGAGFAEAGSFDTYRAGLSLSGGDDIVEARLGASTIRTDGISKADARFGNPETDPYRSTAIDGRLALSLTPEARVELFGRYTDSTNHFDSAGGPTGVRDGDEIGETRESLLGLVGRLEAFDGRLQNILQVSRSTVERRNETRGQPSFTGDGQRDALRYQGTINVVDGVVGVLGAEHERMLSDTGAGSSETTINGAFGLIEVGLIETLHLSGGVRHDDHSRFGGVTTGSVGLSWAALETLTVRANWSQGFKAPTLYQLTMYFPPAVSANGDLRPEESESWDAGATLSLLGDRLRLDATYFRIETDNLIQYAGGRYFNIARATSDGVEAALAAPLWEDVTVRASYTYTDARNSETGLRLSRIPLHAAALTVDWQASEAFGLTGTLRYNGDEHDTVRVANPDGRIDAWTRLDIAMRYDLTDALQLYGRVENVTDTAYQDVFGYGTPGRAVYGGVRLRFE